MLAWHAAIGLLATLWLAACGGAPTSSARPSLSPSPPLFEAYYPPPESAGGWRATSDPEAIERLGLDPAKLVEFGAYNLSVPSPTGPTGVLVIKDGWLVAEVYDRSDGRQHLYRLASNGKTAAMLLFGVLVEASRTGRLALPLALDSLLYDPRWLPEGFPLSDPRKSSITFDQVFRHTSGILPASVGSVRSSSFAEYTVGHDPDHPESRPLYFDPGAPQCHEGALDLPAGYSGTAFDHLSLVFQRLAGMAPGAYLRQQLLEPIGVERVRLAAVRGYDWAASGGLDLAARDYARLAYLMLRGGQWEDRELVPAWWLARFTDSAAYVNLRANHDGYFGTGYPADMYRIVGSGLNWAFIVPSLDLVAVRVGRTSDASFDAVQRTFLQKLFAAVTAPVPDLPAGPFVRSLTLVDADTDRPIAGFDPMACGAKLRLRALPTRNLNIEVKTSPSRVGSVRFELDGDADYHVESHEPYTLAGHSGADYFGWTPTPGTHLFTATPYTGPSGEGISGVPHTITFVVTE